MEFGVEFRQGVMLNSIASDDYSDHLEIRECFIKACIYLHEVISIHGGEWSSH